MQTRRLNRLPPGRKRSAPAAIPELQAMKGLDLARWAAAARAGGLPLRSVAQLIGYTPRGLSKLLSVYSTDSFVARDQAIGLALEWERQGAAALQQATTDALAWLQSATSNPDTDAREVAAALSATIQSGHRLAEAGARCARRYTPETPQPQARFDLQGFLGQVAAAAAQVRALPPEQQPNAWDQLRTHCHQLGQQQLGEAAEPATTVTVSAVHDGHDERGGGEAEWSATVPDAPVAESSVPGTRHIPSRWLRQQAGRRHALCGAGLGGGSTRYQSRRSA